MQNYSYTAKSGTFGPPARLLRSPVFFTRILQAAVALGALFLLPLLLSSSWALRLAFVGGVALVGTAFAAPAVQTRPWLLTTVQAAAGLLIAVAVQPKGIYTNPLHLLLMALVTWSAPLLSWTQAIGMALFMHVIYVGAKVSWDFGPLLQKFFDSATVVDVSGAVILAVAAKNWHQLNEAVRKTAVELAAVTSSACDLMVVLDKTGLVRSVNGACRAVLGCEPEELVRRSPEYLGTPEADNLRQLLRSGQPAYGILAHCRRADGEPIWLEWNIEPLPELEALLCVGRDVTKRIGRSDPPNE